jgi:hypothetical protein
VVHAAHGEPLRAASRGGLAREGAARTEGRPSPAGPRLPSDVATPWSNGPIEGHINRLKAIKRQMHGRAGFELLRACVLPFEPFPVC